MPEESTQWAKGAYVRCRSLRGLFIKNAEWVHYTTFELGSAILAWALEFSGQVVSWFQRSVSHGKTAYERWKQKKYRKPLTPASW